MIIKCNKQTDMEIIFTSSNQKIHIFARTKAKNYDRIATQ